MDHARYLSISYYILTNLIIFFSSILNKTNGKSEFKDENRFENALKFINLYKISVYSSVIRAIYLFYKTIIRKKI